MAWTIVATVPESRVRGLLAEVHPEIDGPASEAVLRAFCARMLDRSMRVGLVFTPTHTHVIRDLVIERSAAGGRFRIEQLATAPLLAGVRAGPPARDEKLVQQVRQWLEAVSSSWSSYLSSEAVEKMVPDVVGNVFGADIDTWEDPLAAHHAVV